MGRPPPRFRRPDEELVRPPLVAAGEPVRLPHAEVSRPDDPAMAREMVAANGNQMVQDREVSS